MSLDPTETPQPATSYEVADAPEEVGWIPSPDNQIHGYGDPEKGKWFKFLFPKTIDVRTVAPVRSIETAGANFTAFTIRLRNGVPAQRIVGRDENRKGVTILNPSGGVSVFFGPDPEVTASAGTLPSGVSLGLNTKADIWALPNGADQDITVVLVFE